MQVGAETSLDVVLSTCPQKGNRRNPFALELTTGHLNSLLSQTRSEGSPAWELKRRKDPNVKSRGGRKGQCLSSLVGPLTPLPCPLVGPYSNTPTGPPKKLLFWEPPELTPMHASNISLQRPPPLYDRKRDARGTLAALLQTHLPQVTSLSSDAKGLAVSSGTSLQV